MAHYNENIVTVDLNTGTINRSFMNKAIGEGDILGNRYGVRCIRDGQPVRLNGCSCVGYFIRADETTVVIDGGYVADDTAYITLPESCYTVEGNFTLAIKLSNSSHTATIRIVDGTVVDTSLGQFIDPGSVIPDLSDLLAVIADAEAAADTVFAFEIYTELIEDEDYRLIVNHNRE